MSATSEKIGIVGAGPFGLALASMLCRAGRETLLWSQRSEVVDRINSTHRSPHFGDTAIPEGVEVTDDVESFGKRTRFLIIAVSSDTVRQRMEVLGRVVTGAHMAVHAIGAFGKQGDLPVTEIISQETPILRTGVIAGPSMPADLMAGRGTSLVCASEFQEVTRECRRLLGIPPVMRLYVSSDVIGVELASALSGAYTIAIGLADALGVGIGTRAVLMTRAVSEMSRLGASVGAQARTFAGLGGLGNLLVRSSVEGEHLSPSYRLGQSLVNKAEIGSQEEGARAARAGLRMANSHGLTLPVLTTIVRILDGELSATSAAEELVKTVAQAE